MQNWIVFSLSARNLAETCVRGNVAGTWTNRSDWLVFGLSARTLTGDCVRGSAAGYMGKQMRRLQGLGCLVQTTMRDQKNQENHNNLRKWNRKA